MRQINWQNKSELLMVINLLLLASVLGFLYCLLALLFEFSGIDSTSLLLYLAWFVVSMISLHLMRIGDTWGAYALAIATLLIGLYEIGNGTATFGGAVLAAWVFFLVLYYLLNTNPLDDDENQRISSTS